MVINIIAKAYFSLKVISFIWLSLILYQNMVLYVLFIIIEMYHKILIKLLYAYIILEQKSTLLEIKKVI